MNSKEFFYLVAQMRSAQKEYFMNHDRHVFMACRKLENQVDAEIERVRQVLNDGEVRA